MKLLILSDIHGQPENLDKIEEQFKAADAVVFAGDFTEMNKPETGIPAIEALAKKHESVFAVTGNCDDPELMGELEMRDMNVQKALVMNEGLAFAGCGGGTIFTSTTPNERTEEEIVADFKIITDQGKQKWNNLVAIMHNPPKDTDCDAITGGIHVGSQHLRNFIEEYEPLLVVTGHIHESAGICKIGDTTVINPGALFEGRYGIAEAEKENGEWKITKISLETI